MSVSVWVSNIFFKTGFSGLGLGFGFSLLISRVRKTDLINCFLLNAKFLIYRCKIEKKQIS